MMNDGPSDPSPADEFPPIPGVVSAAFVAHRQDDPLLVWRALARLHSRAREAGLAPGRSFGLSLIANQADMKEPRTREALRRLEALEFVIKESPAEADAWALPGAAGDPR
jgi:hypothetical protein